MSYRVSHFESLRQRFPSFEELQKYLTSSEGGSLRYAADDTMGILHKGNGQNVSTDMFRSVVWDTVNNLPLCVAPFKAKEGLPPPHTNLSATENFVDGFMMNAWVGSDGILRLATRKKIGGENKFYSEKTFGTMFQECVASTPLKTLDALKNELNTLRVEQAATSVFVSFVLQHPEHRIVNKPVTPSMNVVHMGTVTSTGAIDMSEKAANWPQAFTRLQIPSYPVKVFHSEEEIHTLVRRTNVEKGWRWQGLVFKDGQGNRWRIRTSTYTMMRELRGAEASPLDRFFRLRAARQVMDYLKHYSEERDTFWQFEETLRAKTSDVFAAYIDVHKAHAVEFKNLPEALKPAVFMLHLKWRDELRGKGFKVRIQNVIEVVNSMRDFEKERLMTAAPYNAVARREHRDTPAPSASASYNDLPALIPVDEV